MSLPGMRARAADKIGSVRTGVRAARRRVLHSRRRILQIALPTVVVLGAGAALAAGAIPGNDGTITACYANKTDENGNPQIVVVDNIAEPPGALRVIDPSRPTPPGAAPDPAASCVAGETQVTWNQAGPQGPPGQPGAAGAIGAQGAQGTSLLGETTLGLSARDAPMFLKLDGIEGESQDDGHKNQIEISSFSLGSQSTGAGAGKITFNPFQVTRKVDRSSPQLLAAAVTGRRIPKAELFFTHRRGGKDVTFLELDFMNVQVSTVQDGASAKDVPTESVSLNYQKLEMTYYDAEGKPGPSVSVNVGSALKP
ncbi:MAG TPA: type VI secretion system tube protein Hcp [Solirubrobacterales bacterium]|jgi:type VI secretion system secreted protein Hcp|nr:type VI secretion system tube protein Hcp [Solirubrobacterales bacterium]